MAKIQLKPVNEQIVVVFGASSGIGRATAKRFASRKATVVAVGRDKAALDALVHEIESASGHAVAMIADTAIFQEVKSVADETVRCFGRIDTWVHVAGTGIYSRFADMQPEEFERSIHVNLMGQVYGAMAALPHLRKNGRGALIHVSSVESQIGLPFQSAYASAKHGMKGFLDVLWLELKHDKVPVSLTNIMPATIDTPFFSNSMTKLGFKPRAMPPVYQPEQVAEAIVHAAESPRRNIVVGAAGHVLIWMKRLLPGVIDFMLLKTAFKGQLSKEKKMPYAPSSFYAPDTHDPRIHGGWTSHGQAA